MMTIEGFLLLAAIVVVIGLVVRHRDLRRGDAPTADAGEPALPMRERFADNGFLPAAAWRVLTARPSGKRRGADGPVAGGSAGEGRARRPGN